MSSILLSALLSLRLMLACGFEDFYPSLNLHLLLSATETPVRVSVNGHKFLMKQVYLFATTLT